MTETDWLTCATRPTEMLRQAVRPSVPLWKLQLVGCAACRLVWDRMSTFEAEAVGRMERCLDGEEDKDHFIGSFDRADIDDWTNSPRSEGVVDDSVGRAADMAALALIAHCSRNEGPGRCLEWVQETISLATPPGEKRAALKRTRRQICDLFREVIGNPFRPWTVVPDFLGGGVVQPDGKTVRLTDTSRRLAEGIRADQGFDRLPILADALEEAGVTDAELLGHCRREGGHVRGCWALDVVLGKG